MERKAITFVMKVEFEGVPEKEQPPQTMVHAFDSRGKLLTSAPVDKGQARLSLPPESAGRVARLFLSPRIEEEEPVTVSKLSRLGAYEKRLRVDPKNPRADLIILDPIWKRWLLCPCVVRGRLVKRLKLPDGTIKEMPICHARVTICEVDSVPAIIWRLPDDLLVRLRDDLIDVIQRPLPIPPEPFPPKPFPEPEPPGPGPEFGAMFGEMGFERSQAGEAVKLEAGSIKLQLADTQTQDRIRVIASATSNVELRRALVNLADLIRPFICGWPWLDPLVRYSMDCIRTVMVDENGRFETTIYYPCFGDKPDLYFKAEQPHGAIWETIYEPSVRCNTYWNYECGTEIVINVTDPSAIPCTPDDPVDLPPGVTTWVMPFAVGGTKIWGSPPGAPSSPAGWVKSNGLTDYAGFVDAPFGGRLGFRHGYSNDIPNGIKYYRWSYRKAGTSNWFHMHQEVVRHYVHQMPGMLPTFPVYALGPKTVGASANLFDFKPPAPPGPAPGDPPGTITYWPTDDIFADIYSGFLSTPALPPDIAGAAGQYQIRLEVFDAAGNQVSPGAGTFQFIVPSGVAADGVTVLARQAQPAELAAGGFIFNLQIDNNECSAAIDPPNIGGTSVTDACGFLRYDPASTTPVTIAFHAQHPNNFAEFNFRITRGATFLAAASAINQEVAALAAGPYTGDGVGNFDNDFPRATLLGSCVNAAFAETLYVFAKATTGWGHRISAYDASAVRAFALAPEES